MEALGVVGFVLALVAIARFESLKKDVAKLQAELSELRGETAPADTQGSDQQ